jgi:hypothetical protein
LKVEVAEVEVEVKYSPTTCPATESLAYGEVVPMPTFVPLSYTREFSNADPFHFGM